MPQAGRLVSHDNLPALCDVYSPLLPLLSPTLLYLLVLVTAVVVSQYVAAAQRGQSVSADICLMHLFSSRPESRCHHLK